MKVFVTLCLAVVLLSSLNQIQATPTSQYQPQINAAVKYLVGHFVPAIGLIYESEDAGKTHWLARTEYPNYHWNYSETYWLYSDNMFAEAALQPWTPEISQQINLTIHKYNPPFSNKFESVIGVPVGSDRQATDVIVTTGSNYAILYRIHDGVLANPSIPYADAIIYRALSEHYLGQQDLAVKDVNWAASLWNGTCVVDYGVTQTYLTPGNAPSDINFCMNMKVAVILYGAAVVGVTLLRHNEMLNQLLRSQNSNGGIVTLATGHGDPSGSANTETTSLFLLLFNQQLISKLRSETSYSQTSDTSTPEFSAAPIILLTLTITVTLLVTRKRWHQ